MKILSTLMIIFLFASSVIAQDISLFDKLIGTWEGNYEIGGYKNKETMTNKWILDGKYFQVEIAGQMADDPNSKYFSMSIFTFDKDDNIVGWYFDDQGYRNQMTWTGKTKGDKIEIIGKNSDGSMKLSYEVKDGKLVNKREYNYGGKTSKADVEFTKK